MLKIIKFTLLVLAITLAGCSSGTNTQDLKQFTDKVLAKPRGRIDPLPEFKPYSSFVYSASGLRSPFESPLELEDALIIKPSSVNAPNLNRPRQALEHYAMSELVLVGTLARTEGDTALNGLIRTSDGNVHTITSGGYMGKNHGKVISIKESQIDLIEVVPNGSGGWISRPHTLVIQGAVGDN